MKTKIIFFSFLLLSIISLKAQDIITRKDGEKLKVIIKKVTKNTIKYVIFEDPNGVLFTIDKVLIKEVKFAYGKDLDITNPEKDLLYFSEDKIQNIMLNFSALAGNTFALSYERNLKLGQSVMGEVKFYGLGAKNEIEKRRNGVGIDFHYRLKTQSLFNKEEYRPKHILNGPYFAPVIGFSTGEIIYDNSFNPTLSKSVSHTLIHFGIQYGNQWIIQRKISIDASFGFHFYIGKSKKNNYEDSLRLGNMIGENNKLFSFNFRVGFLTGKKTFANKNKN